ncbi:PIH1 domain-containing protein 2 [Phytophthora citrophthora]|uniref:PIH1 domain-containing protein 2 n=1 Tax=Phytophthora citrophthora TaxID=4793 RepID=A0AAD9GNL3_9STRA|nr:PIH1 domain-containing protein 2 [Phytophthora citrophthora]
MNYGIINNRRPDPQKHGAASSVNALLADPRMREIAKQMGLQPKDFGEEAQALWNTLNDLSTSDPKRYESFINEQLQDGPPSEVSNQLSTDTPRFFTPEPGFVIKCCMYHSIKCQQKETKLFLNICAHTLIDLPKNPNSGLEVPEDTRAVPNTNSLQVPLVVGKLREITDFSGAVCCVVDVVVNPWVLRRCEWDSNFKRETMKLAVQWVQEDAQVRLVTPTGKFIKARYKGGVTVGSEIITSKFRIEDADPTKQRMESPADLLKQLNGEEAKKDEDTHELKITPSKENITARKPDILLKVTSREQTQPPPAPVEAKPQKILIEELPSPPSKQKTAARSKQNAKSAAQGKTKNGGAVKRGFLNSSKAQLYPNGSNEGRPSSSYVNLLSRSKVVDLGEMEKQQKGPSQKRMATSPGSDEIDHGDHIFDQLCEQAEPDLKTTNTTRTDTNNGDQLFGEGFEELAKLLAP